MVLNRLKNKIGLSEHGDQGASGEGVDEIGSENQSILLGIISQLRPGCDLTRITLPTFILEKKSMLERITNAFFTPDILIEANSTVDDVERFLLIVKWYLSGWHIAPKAVKKPLNPILGEVYGCYWDNLPDGNSAYYVAEQTSHHPPESSYFYLLPEKHIRADGVLIPESRFLGNSSAALMKGVAYVTLGEHDGEVYSVTQPNIYGRGILFGKLRYELGDHMLIKCEKTGLEADIEFKTKGFISGDYDTIDGTIKRGSDTLYTISGKWNGVMEYQPPSGEKRVLYDTSKALIFHPKVKAIEEQLPNESRRLWQSTIAALEVNDHTTATNEKFEVENLQREKAKERSERGESFEASLFKKSGRQDIAYVINANIDIQNDSPSQAISKLSEVYNPLPRKTSS